MLVAWACIALADEPGPADGDGHRDEFAFSEGVTVYRRTWWDDRRTFASMSMALEGPSRYGLSARTVVDWLWHPGWDEAPPGTRAAMLLVANHRLGPGTWHAEVALGPALWWVGASFLDRQTYWGGRADVGIELRPTDHLSVRLGVARAVFPTARRDLPWYDVGFQGSLVTTFWILPDL
jgi:hypothetical protein